LLNLFPHKRGFLVALFTAAEDASTGVFFFFTLIYKTGISLRALFLGYTAVPLAYVAVILLQPKKPILAVKMENRGEYYPISRQPLRVQAKSLAYWLLVAWNCICCITTYFYLGNMHEQLLWLFGDEEAATAGTQLFSLFFMVQGHIIPMGCISTLTIVLHVDISFCDRSPDRLGTQLARNLALSCFRGCPDGYLWPLQFDTILACSVLNLVYVCHLPLLLHWCTYKFSLHWRRLHSDAFFPT
jgi:hypothetical protein